MKRPLVACLVDYAWLSASILNRHLGAVSMSTLLTKSSSDEVKLSTLIHEQLTLAIIASSVYILGASCAALF